MKPRGIRNNNPGNIEYSPRTKWRGLDPDKPSDGRFCRFLEPEYGIRAIAMILKTYQRKHRLNTVTDIIDRWAPPHENDTRSYAKHVAERLGVGVNASFDVTAFQFMKPLVESIIRHENGQQPYTDEQIAEGLKLAGVKP